MPEMSLKDGWTLVAFGDVVRLSRERSSDPEADGFERYVGLDHIDPGDLTVRRWGDIADGTTFTSVFRSGHVLFGKRRAYQGKVAVADFSGVCSSDIYVLEAKSSQLLPELLPFICQTGGFFDHAIGTSAGSLSPRTNWQSLASYGFALPPLDEQRRIAIALRSFQTTRESLRIASLSGRQAQASALEEMTRVVEDCVTLSVSELCRKDRPLCYGVVQPGVDVEDGVPLIRVCDIENDRLNIASLNRISADIHKQYQRSTVDVGDVLLSVVGTIGRVFVVSPAEAGFNIARAIAKMSLSSRIAPDFLANYLRSKKLQAQLSAAAFESARKTLNLEALGKLRIPVPEWALQVGWNERILAMRDGIARLQMREAKAALSQRLLAEKSLGGIGS